MKVRTIFLGLVLLGLGASLIGCGNKEKKVKDWAEIEKSGKMIIGLDDSFVPMGFRDEKNQLVGFDIDLAKALGKELGVEVDFQTIDWSMKETELSNGTIDAIWNGYTVTDQREKEVSFSQSYLKNTQVLVTMKASDISKLSQMKDKQIGIQEGSSGEDTFNNQPELLKDFVKNQEAISFPAFTEAFMDLEAGRIDGLLIDNVFAEYYISKQADKAQYVVITTDFSEENYAIGFRKQASETVNKVNEGLTNLYSSGISGKISEKWFGDNCVVK